MGIASVARLKDVGSASAGVAVADAHHFRLFGASRLVVAVVASLAWMTASSCLILLNKELLSNGFHYPMALSSLGMAFSGAASYLCCQARSRSSRARDAGGITVCCVTTLLLLSHLRFLSPTTVPLRKQVQVCNIVEAKKVVTAHFYVTKILPVGFFMALTLHFGNLVYLHLSVAFIQILKALTPVITLVTLFLARLETPTRPLILSVTFIALGTALASAGEVNLSTIGVLIMLSSEMFESIRLVMTQLLLTGLQFHPIEGLMYLAPACTFWLFLGSLLLESRRMAAEGALGLMATQPGKFVLAAAMGFMVNSLAYIVIQSASSLTLKVLGTVKNALVVCLGIVLLGDRVTLLQGAGYAISVAAFFMYQRIKVRQLAGDTAGKHDADGWSIAAEGSSRLGTDGELPRFKAMPTGEEAKAALPLFGSSMPTTR